MAETKRRLAAILSADVVGYSRLMQDDEAATVETLTKYREIFRDFVTRHDGRVVDSPGDNILSEFDSPVEAVQCAVEVQRELERRNRQLAEHRQMHFRIGINLGDVISRDDGTIYGDGVNVAARLESLAEPGGIMISETAQMQVHSLIDVGIADAGEHEVKNMAQPVHAFQIVLDGPKPVSEPRPGPAFLRKPAIVVALVLVVSIAGLVVWFADQSEVATTDDATTTDQIFAVPTGPSIAVLPFENLSGDPEQDYFANGLTEELITALSRFQDLKTIGRQSTMQYQGAAVDVREAGRELGVDFIFEGSVRRSQDTLRIGAKLVDVRDGRQIWAESYDRAPNIDDLLSIQDEVTGQIVATIADSYGVIGRQIARQSKGHSAKSWEAYDCVLRYHEYQDILTEELLLRGIDCFESATAADPGFADGWGFLAEMYAEGSTQFDLGGAARAKALDAGLKAVKADPFSQEAHWGLALAHFHRGEMEVFKESAYKALELNPNRAYLVGFIGLSLWHAGEWEPGLALIDKSYELNPQGPTWLYFPFAWDHFRLGEYEEALSDADRIKTPDFWYDPMLHATILGQLGRTDSAKAALDQALELKPDMAETIRSNLLPYFRVDPELLERILDGLRKAGLDIPDELAPPE